MVRVNEQSDERSFNVCAVLGKQARSMVPTAASDDAQGDPQPQLRGIALCRQPHKVELGFVEIMGLRSFFTSGHSVACPAWSLSGGDAREVPARPPPPVFWSTLPGRPGCLYEGIWAPRVVEGWADYGHLDGASRVGGVSLEASLRISRNN